MKYLIRKIIRKIAGNIFEKNMVLDHIASIDARLWFSPQSEIGKSLYYTGTFEPEELSLLRRIVKHDDIVIDIGANMGSHAIAMAKKTVNGKVYAIEPAQSNFDLLQRNIEINHLTNIVPLRTAVGEKSGTQEMNIYEDQAFNSMLVLNRKKAVGKEIVQVLSLDDLREQEHISKIDLIKIDTEGYEMSILKGAKKILSSEKKPILIVEINEENIKPLGLNQSDVINYIVSFGYKSSPITNDDYLFIPLGSEIIRDISL
jgi:FkbM family methyltransferase